MPDRPNGRHNRVQRRREVVEKELEESINFLYLGFREEIWQIRMREIQGDICVASIFQLVIGYTGLIGLMLR